MGISYEEAVEAQKKYEDHLLDDPNVISIGVIAETDEIGRKTGSYIVQVGVASIEEYNHSKDHGSSIIPAELLIHYDGSKDVKHIRVNVVQQGKIEALSKTAETEIPDARDKLLSTEDISHSNITRRRPIPCGYSIGHVTITSGTIGLILEYENGPNMGKAYILSNNHVLAAENKGFIGDDIIQSGAHDYGIKGMDTIARLHRWVPLNSVANFVDATIAEVHGGVYWDKYVIPYVSKIGYPVDIVEPKIGQSVVKSGRTTEYTTGEITSVNMTLKVNYNMGRLLFKEQIQTTNMSKPGDSGSSLFLGGTSSVVGLLFAGSQSASFFNPMKNVLKLLSDEHKHKYPSGKSVKMERAFPLKIITRKLSTQAYPRKMSVTPLVRSMPKTAAIVIGVGTILGQSMKKLWGESRDITKQFYFTHSK